MYAKFAAAIACLILCSLNVVAAVKRTPIRTTVEMMPSSKQSKTKSLDKPICL
jgi:hypothetical protein